MQCSNLPRYSITSYAAASSVCGTVMPSALAVLRLITSSYLVGACTGRSADHCVRASDHCRRNVGSRRSAGIGSIAMWLGA